MLNKRNYFYLGLSVLALTAVTLACSLFGGSSGSTTVSQATSTPSSLTADFGDAPDNLDAGYYAPSGGPYLYTYDAAGIEGRFPTYGRDQIPGAFTLQVDQFWIGPLYGRAGSGDIPSLEDDADDPNDPDGVANLTVNGGGADCDMENGFHSPAASGCASQAAYSMPMNARLSIMFGQPPLGIWITSVTAADNMTYSGPVYWNLLFDLNQDGDWEDGGEWIAQDVVVDLQPGETETLISPAFHFPTSGSPWGRLNFPYWVRSMVTSESVADAVGSGNWDGRGPDSGFSVGEVEDYFVEWKPIGQKRKGQGGGGGAGASSAACTPTDAQELTLLPVNRDISDVIRLTPGGQVQNVQVLGLPGLEGGSPADHWGDLDLTQGATLRQSDAFTEINLEAIDGVLDLSARTSSQDGYRLILVPNTLSDGDCTGNAPVYVGPMFYREFPPPLTTSSPFGWYDVTSSYFEGDESHNPFTLGETIKRIMAEEGSIIFSGDPPFVTVEGDFVQNSGEFSAAGIGVVAGYPDIAVTFEGNLADGELQGYYTMGAEGGLPGGESVTYQIIGTKAQEELTEESSSGPVGLPTIDPGVEDAIGTFIDVFNGAFRETDPDPLFQLLHPAVFDIYGEEACRAYLEGIIDNPTSLEYQNAQWFGPWDFERDGVSKPVEDTYLVGVNFSSAGSTSPQELHLAVPGDASVRWFTDCGEPLEQ